MRSPPRRLPSPVLDPLERDKRTVFCMQLAARLQSRELFEFFRHCGRIREARLVQDKISKRSKGYRLLISVAYVEFHDEDSVPKAIAMSGHKLLGIPIIVHSSESEKNRLAEGGITVTTLRYFYSNQSSNPSTSNKQTFCWLFTISGDRK